MTIYRLDATQHKYSGNFIVHDHNQQNRMNYQEMMN